MHRSATTVLLATLVACRPAAPSSTPADDPAPATPRAAASKQGVHGMVVFGRDAMYASHLPMYDAPHDVQAVLRLVPREPEVLESWRRELSHEPIATFVPQPFDLATLREGGTIALVGDLYRGHFERGGDVYSEAVEFDAEVVFYREIPPTPPRSTEAFAFGDGDHTYLVPIIGPRPGVDRILACDGPAPATVQTTALDDATLARHGWTSKRVIYEERADLQ
ncbi:MAG: hypothetical protein K1X88_03580 [Nannocystaceae bacterium]|nr:hypothetical protein [Nannocystaceae bacterium]